MRKSSLQPRSWTRHKELQNTLVLVAYSAGESMDFARWWSKPPPNGRVWPSAEYLPTSPLVSSAEISSHSMAIWCRGPFLLFVCLVFDIPVRIMSGTWHHYIKVSYCPSPGRREGQHPVGSCSQGFQLHQWFARGHVWTELWFGC